MASSGVSTIGWAFLFSDVLSSIGTPVIRKKAEMRAW
jgi:hypothetical protein